jgi:hypothetical protein
MKYYPQQPQQGIVLHAVAANPMMMTTTTSTMNITNHGTISNEKDVTSAVVREDDL